MEIAPFCIDTSKVLVILFVVFKQLVLLTWYQNKACVTLDQYFIPALIYIAVWSNCAVKNLTGCHFETLSSSLNFLKNT